MFLSPLLTTLTINPVVLPLQPFKVQNAMYDRSHFESSLVTVKKINIFSCSCHSKCCSSHFFFGGFCCVMSSNLGETTTTQICTHGSVCHLWTPAMSAAFFDGVFAHTNLMLCIFWFQKENSEITCSNGPIHFHFSKINHKRSQKPVPFDFFFF